MDSGLYDELRNSLREQKTYEKMRHDFIKTLLEIIEEKTEKAIGKQGKKLCLWGVIGDDGNFVQGKYTYDRHGFKFALQIAFDDSKGSIIFKHAVPFTAEEHDDFTIINCGGDHVTIDDDTLESDVDLIPALLDKPLQEAVYGVEWDPND